MRLANPFLLAYVVWFVGAAVINLFFFGNADALHSLKDALPGLVLYASMLVWIDDWWKFRSAHKWLLITLAIMAALGTAQYLFGWPYPNAIDTRAYLKQSLTGLSYIGHPVVATLGHPNALAVFLGPFLVLLVAWWSAASRSQPEGGRIWLIPPILFLLFVCLALTQVKAAGSVSLLGALLCLWASSKKLAYRFRIGLATMLGFLVLGCGLVFLATRIPTRVPEGFALATIAERISLNFEAVDLVTASPSISVFGGGVKAFGEATKTQLGVHNEFLRQVLQVGLPGGFLFCGALLWPLVREGGAGWTYRAPVFTMILIFLVEAAAGNQLQSMIFLVLGFADVDRINRLREPCSGVA